MTARPGDVSEASLSPEDSAWLTAVGGAESLAELADIVGTDSEQEAYFEAKEQWRTLQEKQQVRRFERAFPGEGVEIDGQEFVVHGITHANTDEERAFLHEHVESFLDDGHAVYCEQGIRPMYFSEFDSVCEIDDYSWAMHHCQKEDIDSHVEGLDEPALEESTGQLREAISRFRTATFSLIESGSEVYGDQFARALGDVASDFLMNNEEIATADDFESFTLSRQASRNPEKLATLQQYYRATFLPQPLEREWLRRHDRELELFTHARNERIADYVVYHASADTVHVIVGAAHLPGVLYYLEEHREGSRDASDFEFIE